MHEHRADTQLGHYGQRDHSYIIIIMYYGSVMMVVVLLSSFCLDQRKQNLSTEYGISEHSNTCVLSNLRKKGNQVPIIERMYHTSNVTSDKRLNVRISMGKVSTHLNARVK